jgi:hypothetical protein
LQVSLSGTASHTHGSGDSLVTLAWKDIRSGYAVAKNAGAISCFYPFGAHTVSLTITDNNGATDSTTKTFIVSPDDKASGTLVKIYAGGSLAALPAKAIYGALASSAFALQTNDVPSGLTGIVILQLVAKTSFPGTPVTFTFTGISSSTPVWIGIDGVMKVSAVNVAVPAGQHLLDIRCAHLSSSVAPRLL